MAGGGWHAVVEGVAEHREQDYFMTVVFVSPSEPETLRKIGVTDLLPEEYGVDIYWVANSKKCGIQRKEFPNDFIASVHDGRLGEQLAKGENLDCMFLVLEGRPSWTTEGKLIRGNGGKRWPYDRSQHRRLLATVMSKGVQVFTSDGIYDTIDVVGDLVAWTSKEEHISLDRRSGPPKTKWGRRTNKHWQKHFIQGLPGVGPKQAQAIMDEIGFPFELSVTVEDLMRVPGIGKTIAKRISDVFDKKDGIDGTDG